MANLLTHEELQSQLAKKLKLPVGQRLDVKKLTTPQREAYNQFLRDYALVTGMDNIHIKDGKPMIKGSLLDKLGLQIANVYNQKPTARNERTIIVAKNNMFVALPADQATAVADNQIAVAQTRLAKEASLKTAKTTSKDQVLAIETPLTNIVTPAPALEKFDYIRVEAKTIRQNIDAMLLQMGILPTAPDYADKKKLLQREVDHYFPQGKASKGGGTGHKSAHLKIAADGSYSFTQNAPMADDGHTVALNRDNGRKITKDLLMHTVVDNTVVAPEVKQVETLVTVKKLLDESLNAARAATKDLVGQERDNAINAALRQVLAQYPDYINQDLDDQALRAAYEDLYKLEPESYLKPRQNKLEQQPFVVEVVPLNNAQAIQDGNLQRVIVAPTPLVIQPEISKPANFEQPIDPQTETLEAVVIETPTEPDEAVIEPVEQTLVIDPEAIQPSTNLTVTRGGLFDKAWKKVAAVAAGVALVASVALAAANGIFSNKDDAKQKLPTAKKPTTTIINTTPSPAGLTPVASPAIDTVDIGAGPALSTPNVATVVSTTTGSTPATTLSNFGQAFAKAREGNLAVFKWNGKEFVVDTRDEVNAWKQNAKLGDYLKAGAPNRPAQYKLAQ